MLEAPHSILLKLQPALGGISTDVFLYFSYFFNLRQTSCSKNALDCSLQAVIFVEICYCKHEGR
jgi:hypothetical protein